MKPLPDDLYLCEQECRSLCSLLDHGCEDATLHAVSTNVPLLLGGVLQMQLLGYRRRTSRRGRARQLRDRCRVKPRLRFLTLRSSFRQRAHSHRPHSCDHTGTLDTIRLGCHPNMSSGLEAIYSLPPEKSLRVRPRYGVPLSY